MGKKEADSDDERTKPSKFDGQDFHIWKRRMTTYLKDKKLWSITERGFTTSVCGNKYVVVITDYFTRWADAFAVPDIEASTVARNHYASYHKGDAVPINVRERSNNTS
ncbi:hypothetical protein HDU67_001145 [Dinochytrium kinnereticum]|nr:hypothetical protein HDU67_001145 [Dinochytrium kinnereticum]